MKHFKIFLSLLLILFIFTGCSTERKSLNELSIVEGMGIDYSDGQVNVTVQTLNLAKEGSGAEALSGNVTMNTSGSGSSISSAIENLTESLSKKLFFGQNRIIVFGMGMAEEHIEKNLDYLLRSSDSRSDVLICVSEKEAVEIMNSQENDALVPAESVASLLKLGESGGYAAMVTSNELLNLYLDKTSDIYLPVIKSNDKSVSVEGIAIYNKEKLVAVLDEKKTFGFLFLSDKINSGYLSVESEKLGEIGVNVISSKTKARASYSDGRVVYTAKIKTQLMLDAVEQGLVNTLSNDDLRAIEKLVADAVADYCKETFNECTKGKSDPLKVGESLAMYSPKAYEALSDNWQNVMADAELNVSVKCELKKINENSKGD